MMKVLMVSGLENSWTASTGMPSASMLHGFTTTKTVKSAPQYTMGGRHMVRRICFERGTKWIARVRITTTLNENEGSHLLQREVDCIQLVRERTSVPVPTIFGYNASAKNKIGAPFMLMECFSGNVGVDLSGVAIPAQCKAFFHQEMARFQVNCSGTSGGRTALMIH